VLRKLKAAGPIKSSPVVADGIIFFGSNDGHIYAVNAETGREAWRLKTGDKVTRSAAVVDGVVYIASEDGFCYALKARTGEPLWKTKLGRGRPAGSPAVAYGLAFIPSGNSGGSETLHMTAGPEPSLTPFRMAARIGVVVGI
jgi:outer membrane protein assembly factor BamB